MYKWDDILIIGDSWCGERNKPTYWPNQLLHELTSLSEDIPRGQGFHGCAWWSVRNRLFRELDYKPAKVVIIIHTETNRIPSDVDKAITIRGAMNYNSLKDPINRSIYKAAAEYYNHLYCANFHDWAERQWFLELDNFLEKKQVEKVIHLYGITKDKEQKYEFKYGVTIDYPLSKYHMINTSTMKYPNHMTYENNQKLAQFLYKLITNYPGHGFVYKEKPF